VVNRSLLAVGLVCALQGCTTVKLYPVCQYLGTVDEKTRANFVSSTQELVRSVAGDDKAVTVLPSLRYATVNAQRWQHEQLIALWPNIGCLGNYSNSEGRAKYASCQKYVRATLLTDSPGVAENEVLCFSAKDCPGRTIDNADAVIYCNGN